MKLVCCNNCKKVKVCVWFKEIKEIFNKMSEHIFHHKSTVYCSEESALHGKYTEGRETIIYHEIAMLCKEFKNE